MQKGDDKKLNTHTFSVELASKRSLCHMMVSEDGETEVFIEGTLGNILGVELIEGIMLQISGEKGVLRIDISEEDLNILKTYKGI